MVAPQHGSMRMTDDAQKKARRADRTSSGKPGLHHYARVERPADAPVATPVETKARFFYPRDLVMPEDPEPARVEQQPSRPAVKIEIRKPRKFNLL